MLNGANIFLLIVVNAFAKWPEVHVVSSTSASQKMRVIFATHGLPITLVSDNGPPFTSVKFAAFMTGNGILHNWVIRESYISFILKWIGKELCENGEASIRQTR